MLVKCRDLRTLPGTKFRLPGAFNYSAPLWVAAVLGGCLQVNEFQGEDGSGAGITSTGGGGFEFGVDPNDDPELALALRVSMEEQRARQQTEGGEITQ